MDRRLRLEASLLSNRASRATDAAFASETRDKPTITTVTLCPCPDQAYEYVSVIMSTTIPLALRVM